MSWVRLFMLALSLGGPAPGGKPRWDRVRIPAGPFVQGSTRGDEDERPARTRALPAFSIDRTEVTRGDYAGCVAAGRCKPIAAPSVGGDAAVDATSPRLPMTNV